MIRKSQKGFTLIELMLALGLGVIVLVAIVKVFDGSQKNYQLISTMNDFEEQIALANRVVPDEIKKAGYQSLDDLLTGDDWATNAQNIVDPTGSYAGRSRTDPTFATFPYVIGSPAIAIKNNDSAHGVADTPWIEIYYLGDKEHDVRTCTGNLVPNGAMGVSVLYLRNNPDDPALNDLMCKGGVYSADLGIDSYPRNSSTTLVENVDAFYVRGFDRNNYMYYDYEDLIATTGADISGTRRRNTPVFVFEMDFSSIGIAFHRGSGSTFAGVVSSGDDGRISRQTTFSVKVENPL